MVKTYIHYNIVYNSSLHHAIHALKSIAHMEKPKEYGKSFAQKCAWRKSIYKEYGKSFAQNVHDENYKQRNCSHSYRNVHDKNPLKRNGSHLYRNVNEDNPFKKKLQSFVQKCKWRQSNKKEMVVIRTEM